jgi:hypothetical protein
MGQDLRDRIEAAARKGTSVVWILPHISVHDKLKPSFYSVPVGTNFVVLAHFGLVANLRDNPQSQLNLLRLCRLAINLEPVRLPESATQP